MAIAKLFSQSSFLTNKNIYKINIQFIYQIFFFFIFNNEF